MIGQIRCPAAAHSIEHCQPVLLRCIKSGAWCLFALLLSVNQASAQSYTKPVSQADSSQPIGFSIKSLIIPNDPFSNEPGEYLRADQVQELMQPSDDVQNWDAMQASPIVLEDSYRRRAVDLSDPLAPQPLLSDLRFEDDDFVEQVQEGYKDFHRGLTEGLFGKKAAHYFEIDIDKSPEIKFEIHFD